MQKFNFIIEQLKHQNSGMGPVYGFEEKTTKPYTPMLNKVNDRLREFAVDPTLSGISIEAADFIRTLARNQDLLVYLQQRLKDKDINMHSPTFERDMKRNLVYLYANYERCNEMSVQAKHFNTKSIQNNLDAQIEKANELFAIIRQKNPILADKLHNTLNVEMHVERLNNKIRDINAFTVDTPQNKSYAGMGMSR